MKHSLQSIKLPFGMSHARQENSAILFQPNYKSGVAHYAYFVANFFCLDSHIGVNENQVARFNTNQWKKHERLLTCY